MNLLERILGLDFTHPALLAGVGYVLLRELGPRVWRWGVRRSSGLRALPDPIAHDDYEAWRKNRDLAPGSRANLVLAGREYLGREHEAAKRKALKALRCRELDRLSFARWAKYRLGPTGDCSLSDEDWLLRHPPPASLDEKMVAYLVDVDSQRTRERRERYGPPPES